MYRTYCTLPAEFTLEDICSEKGAVLQTAQIQANLAVLKNWVEENRNFIVVGHAGCGKSMLIK